MNRVTAFGKLGQAVRAGFLYFAVVFGFGFVLGVLRRLVVAPAWGEFAAVLLELPIMVAIAWVVCGWVLRTIVVPGAFVDRLAVGATALGLLMIAEATVSMSIAENSLGQHLRSYRETSNFIGLIGQLLYAGFPVVRRER